MSGTVTVVIPTLNEEGNAADMARAIRASYLGYRILFMDDCSTDSTVAEVEGLGDPLTRIVTRDPEDRGLAASVLQGLLLADTDYALCMDCDFQHPVSALGSIIAGLDAGADICVGVRRSRRSMGLWRAFGSHAGDAFCGLTLLVHGRQSCRDLMSGLFAVRCDAIQQVIDAHWEEFEHRGWKVLLDILRHADRRLDIRHVGYDFGVRREGESHLGPEVPIMTCHQLWWSGRLAARVLAGLYGVDYHGLYPEERRPRQGRQDRLLRRDAVVLHDVVRVDHHRGVIVLSVQSDGGGSFRFR